MARQIQGLIPGRIERFVPKSYGNDTDPTPVTIWFRVPTERERRELRAYGDEVCVSGNASNPTVTTKASNELAKQHHAIEAFVTNVENYKTQDGLPITDGQTLANHGESAFVFEVTLAIMSAMSLDEEQTKKSEGSRATCSAPTLATSGIAKNAEVKDSTEIEIVQAKTPPFAMCA